MEIGLGIDGRLVLSDTEQADLAAEAALLGYTSLWTPNGNDPFGLCARWHAASGLRTGSTGWRCGSRLCLSVRTLVQAA